MTMSMNSQDDLFYNGNMNHEAFNSLFDVDESIFEEYDWSSRPVKRARSTSDIVPLEATSPSNGNLSVVAHPLGTQTLRSNSSQTLTFRPIALTPTAPVPLKTTSSSQPSNIMSNNLVLTQAPQQTPFAYNMTNSIPQIRTTQTVRGPSITSVQTPSPPYIPAVLNGSSNMASLINGSPDYYSVDSSDLEPPSLQPENYSTTMKLKLNTKEAQTRLTNRINEVQRFITPAQKEQIKAAFRKQLELQIMGADAVDVPTIIWQAGGKIRHMNAAFTQIVGHSMTTAALIHTITDEKTCAWMFDTCPQLGLNTNQNLVTFHNAGFKSTKGGKAVEGVISITAKRDFFRLPQLYTCHFVPKE